MIKPFKPMLPTLVTEWPVGSDWVYETKYDGYRGQLIVDHDCIHLYSRNLNLLDGTFPEIISFIKSHDFSNFIPFILDGEVCLLESERKADFPAIQKRGRLKKQEKIEQMAKTTPATFVAFDLLLLKGKDLRGLSLTSRKEKLETCNFHEVSIKNNDHVQLVSVESNPESLWRAIEDERGEGIIAKSSKSNWETGKRTTRWLKIKNYQTGVFFITAFDKRNGYFHVGLIKDGDIVPAGLFSHGLSDKERETLIHVIKANKESESKDFIWIQPSLCVELQFIEWYHDELRQPRFSSFKLDWHWEDCTWDTMRANK